MTAPCPELLHAATRTPVTKSVRFRPSTTGVDLTGKIDTIRSFVAKGFIVRVEHLFRGHEPRTLDAVLAHYEAIAEGLQGLRWTSRGPFLERHRVWIEVVLAPPDALACGKRRFPPAWC